MNDVERSEGYTCEDEEREQQKSWSEWFPAYYFHRVKRGNFFLAVVVVLVCGFSLRFSLSSVDVNRKFFFLKFHHTASIIDFRCGQSSFFLKNQWCKESFTAWDENFFNNIAKKKLRKMIFSISNFIMQTSFEAQSEMRKEIFLIIHEMFIGSNFLPLLLLHLLLISPTQSMSIFVCGLN